MNPVGSNLAEDSCLKDQFNNVANSSSGSLSRNVKNATVNTPEHPVSNQSGTETTNPQGPFRSNVDNISIENECDDDKDNFPEGGLRAWLVVLAAFCASFSVFGIINSTAILLDYFSANQLKEYSPDAIGWIFGFSLFLTFFCGAPIGPIFDAYGPRVLVFCGSILLVLSMFLLGECTKYWHFFLVYSVLNGLGGALINTPNIASIGHFFLVKRGNATGIAMTSGSIGGIVFPLMLQRLLPTVGFAWSMRIVGFILLFLLIIANILLRSRLPKKPMTSFRSMSPDLSVFKDLPFAFVTIGIFLMEWGIFVPLTYITSYSIAHGHSTAFGYQVLAILNAGSFFGRFFAGIVADMIGRVNTLILSILLCIIACFALWLPAGDSSAMIIVFAVIFGFVSGSNLSLSPVCVGQMCKTEHYGRYFATCWMVVAFATLTALPLAGALLTALEGDFWGLIVFAGLSYVAAAAALIAARVLKVGWKIRVVY